MNYKTITKLKKSELFWAFSTEPLLQPVLNCLPKISRVLGQFSTGWNQGPVLNCLVVVWKTTAGWRNAPA